MQEYSTPALVLSVAQRGECDGRVVLFTRSLGKVIARAKSVYKTDGKLAAHLQPLSIVQVRLVEKHGIQIVDALVKQRLLSLQMPLRQQIELLAIASLIDAQTAPGHPDAELWELISSDRLASRDFLRVLGFDPEHAQCDRCQRMQPTHFLLRDAVYLCSSCVKTLQREPALGVKRD